MRLGCGCRRSWFGIGRCPCEAPGEVLDADELADAVVQLLKAGAQVGADEDRTWQLRDMEERWRICWERA